MTQARCHLRNTTRWFCFAVVAALFPVLLGADHEVIQKPDYGTPPPCVLQYFGDLEGYGDQEFYVTVSINDEIQKAIGISSALLQSKVELGLRKNGFAISSGKFEKLEGARFDFLTVMIDGIVDGSEVFVGISVRFHEGAYLYRTKRHTWRNAPYLMSCGTWANGYIAKYRLGDARELAIRHTIELVEVFMNDFMRGNPEFAHPPKPTTTAPAEMGSEQ